MLQIRSTFSRQVSTRIAGTATTKNEKEEEDNEAVKETEGLTGLGHYHNPLEGSVSATTREI